MNVHCAELHPSKGRTFKNGKFTRNNDRTLSCEFCAKTYREIDCLKRHELSKHGKSSIKLKLRSYACKICLKKYTQKYYRDQHVLKVHFQPKVRQEIVNILLSSCSLCNQYFENNQPPKKQMIAIHKFHRRHSNC